MPGRWSTGVIVPNSLTGTVDGLARWDCVLAYPELLHENNPGTAQEVQSYIPELTENTWLKELARRMQNLWRLAGRYPNADAAETNTNRSYFERR
jgi:hypothetical protein